VSNFANFFLRKFYTGINKIAIGLVNNHVKCVVFNTLSNNLRSDNRFEKLYFHVEVYFTFALLQINYL